MKSFDIFVGGHTTQSDLIVVNLPVRNDIAAYSWLVLDSSLVNNIIAEKAMSPAENAGGIVFGADADSAITKYEIVSARPIVLDAEAEFEVSYRLGMEENKIELRQELQEVSQKLERLFESVAIGVADNIDVRPLKSIGKTESAIEFGASATDFKNAILTDENGYDGVMPMAGVGDLFVIYYTDAVGGIGVGANVKRLNYLLHMRLIQSNLSVDAEVIAFDYHRSLGKTPVGIAVGANVSFAVEYFTGGESAITLFSEAETFSTKAIDPQVDVIMACEGEAVLRRLRTLGDIDQLDTLAYIDDITLEEMYYADI